MKYLFIFLLFACSKAPDVKPVYISIEGIWKFSSSEINGQFSIVNYGGTLTVDNSDSYGVVNGTRFDVATKQPVNGKLPALLDIYMLNTKSGITFNSVDVNKTYDVMTVGVYTYYVNNSKVSTGVSKLTVTR